MKVTFQVFGKPEPQGSIKAFVPKGWTRPVLTSDNSKLKPWRQQITRVAIESFSGEIIPSGTAVALKLDFFIERPASKPKRITHPTTRPDLDKYCRGVLDALKGVVYEDDSQVCMAILSKSYGTPERVEITVATNNEAFELQTETLELFA